MNASALLRCGLRAHAPFKACLFRAKALHAVHAASSNTGASRRSSTCNAAAQQEMCVIVDENNAVVGAQPRDITVKNRLLGRGAYVLVLSETNELLVSKRTTSKDVYPGHLDVVVAGIVRAGEEYHETAARELHEELGIPLEQASRGLNKLSIFPYQDRWCQVFGCAFTYRHDRSTSQGRDFSLQAEEVEWVRWVPLAQVADMLRSDEQFTPVGRHILQLHQQQLLPK